MRVALISDIHGNSVALEAVLAQIAGEGGADAYWILGDLVALGPDPVGVLERLNALPAVRFLRGNTDRYVFRGDRPTPHAEDASRDVSLIPTLVEISHTFAWTQGMVTAAGWLEWLRDLSLEIRVTLPDGTRFLGVHASPGTDDGEGLLPDTSEAELARMLSGCEADLVCVGHKHRPAEHRWNGVHAITLGAVSLSALPEKTADYAMLTADESGYRVERRSVGYDRAAVIEQLNRLGHPGRAHLIGLLA